VDHDSPWVPFRCWLCEVNFTFAYFCILCQFYCGFRSVMMRGMLTDRTFHSDLDWFNTVCDPVYLS
jgi:hypothetical protein